MHTILFLAGCGVGAFTATCALWFTVARASQQAGRAFDQNKKHHEEVLGRFDRRNELLELQIEHTRRQ